MAYYDALIVKWATLPAGTTAQKLTNINAQTVTLPVQRVIVPSYEIYECLADNAVLTTLTAANQTLLRDLIYLQNVDISPGSKGRLRLDSLFAAGTATRNNINALYARFEPRTQAWWSASLAHGGGELRGPVTNADLVAAGGLT